ncbi:MAG: DUF3540 domain-containing protein [Deltaproteobacteria bacterium]|jgi:hypothetical protein|nr:DUF3540 domain-containing protein [Deltaproteobacteria bacterium]
MTAARSFVGQLDAEALDGRYLGTATVIRSGPAALEVRLPTGEIVHPKLALAFPFVPAPDDSLLVIGQDDRYYVIGVISSRGETQLRFRGSVELRAVDGELELQGDRGVELFGPEIEIKTRKLTVLADKATEIFGTVFTRVKELMSVHTGKTDAIVHGQWSTRSKRAAITSEEAVSINGKQVHLG